MTQTIVVVGGGITGLSAAYQLQKQAQSASADVRILLVERDTWLGGKAQSEVVNGLVIEHGPDSYISYKTWLTTLANELGLSTVTTNPNIRSTYIYHKGRMEKLPVGMNIMIPTEIWPFLKTRLLTPAGKLRAGLEPFVKLKKTDDDESIGSFVGRRFGRDVLDHVAGPLMGGIHGGDWDGISMKATFPSFIKMEKTGSLLIQGLKNKKNRPKGHSGSGFLTVPTGLKSVVDALARACDRVQFRLGTEVVGLRPASSRNEYVVTLSSAEEIDAQAVILATPAYVSADLVKLELPAVAQELNEIPYGNSVVVALAYDKATLGHPLNASGFLVPHTEPLDVTASTWVSSKWLHSAPPDKALLRCYLGRGYGKDWTVESDQTILAAVKAGLKQTMGITAEPELTRIFRWPRAMAQYRVGHLDRVDKIDRLMEGAPGLYLAGAAYRGVGVSDCVREGNTAADKAAKHLGWL